MFTKEAKKKRGLLGILYHMTLKRILNILTLRVVRKFFIKIVERVRCKKHIKLLERSYSSDKLVLIFQSSYFGMEGRECFNGGAERYVMDLINILSNFGYESVLVQRGSFNWERKVGNFSVIGLRNYYLAIRFFTKYRFVIYSGAIYWGKKLLHPNILISHGVTWDIQLNNANIQRIVLRIFKDVDKVVSVDINTITQIRTYYCDFFSNKKAHYIPNYVDEKVFYKKQRTTDLDRVKILFPRRASVERGYWLISELLPSLMNKYLYIDFIFVGYAHGKKIKDDIDRLICLFPTRIKHFCVEPKEMPRYYQQADISIIPSLYAEGTSLSCIEAQICGNVVIATNIGGLPDLIIDGYNGILINPTTQDLMNALEVVLSDNAFMLREKLSKNAVDVAQTFNKSRWIESWEKVIKEFKLTDKIKDDK